MKRRTVGPLVVLTGPASSPELAGWHSSRCVDATPAGSWPRVVVIRLSWRWRPSARTVVLMQRGRG